ncbi:uncharacterized protein C8A04DRAFT_32162 [Dichotomopilus funicola]|uniref:Uncharacterized protein n=1 Tax=Dichotomopilus funicola TaxID=1934379 RepID=A0AAN6ZK52_9PEZI|nr:hypothetical protein C8A04DRAFT_32162 [Dichotomopilus funicola]
MPTFDCLVDPNPDLCEKSHSGIPYPKLEPFARSLLGTQNYSDLEDLIDAMDLTAEWGNEHLPLDDPPDREYLEKKNAMFEAALPEDLPGGRLGLLSLSPRPRREWEKMVRGKQRRIGDETPRERFITRFRKVGSSDPRENTRREV